MTPGKGRILVIDEDPRVMETLEPIFSVKDYEARWAPSGDDGIRLAEELEPDIIMVDLGLTDLPGLDVCRNLRLRNSTWSIPIILVAQANAAEAEIARGLELGANDCVSKPFRQTELLGRLGVLLRVKRVEDKLRRLYVERTKELEWSNMELQKIRTQLILKNQMSTLGMMVAVAAHEIRSPAASISGNLEATGPLLFELVNTLSAATRQLAHAPEDLLRYQDILLQACRINQKEAPREVLERREQLSRLTRMLDQTPIPGAESLPLSSIVKFRLEGLLPELAPLTLRHGGSLLDPLVGLCEMLIKHKNMEISIGRINAIVHAMKGYTHIDRAELQEVDIHTGLDDTLTIMGYLFRGSVELEKHFADSLPHPQGYPGELNQVWTNLLQNAFDALDETGRRIRVETELVERRRRRFVAVRVIDGGRGIPKEILPHIFDSFFTTKEKGRGSGLGLDICKQIIEKHRGTIEVESAPGRTCFTVLLPVDAAPRARTPARGLPVLTEQDLGPSSRRVSRT